MVFGDMLWCTACEVGWARVTGRHCEDCGAEGTHWSIIAPCVASTGLAAEGSAYSRAHPGWSAHERP